MTEQLVSFETAKLAKEKGFDEICTSHYVNEKPFYSVDEPKQLFNTVLRYGNRKETYESTSVLWFKNSDLHYKDNSEKFRFNKGYTAPTQSLLQKWLREEHDIHIIVISNSKNQYFVDYRFSNQRVDNDYDLILLSGVVYNTYEEALEKGLFEALKLM